MKKLSRKEMIEAKSGEDDIGSEELCGGQKKPTTRPTPNGEYECENGVWVWYPSIGRRKK